MTFLITDKNSDLLTKLNQLVNDVEASGGLVRNTVIRSGNFNFDPAINVEYVNLSAANSIGTLPAIPGDAPFRKVIIGRAEPADTGFRFTLGLNGRTINGRGQELSTLLANFEAATAGTNGVAYLESLGLLSVTAGGSTASPGDQQVSVIENAGEAFAGTKYLRLRAEEPYSGQFLQFTTPQTSSSAISFRMRSGSNWAATLTLNGSPQSLNITTTYQLFSFNLPNQANTVRIETPGDSTIFRLDELSITNVQIPPPAAWTDPAPWNIGPGGILIVDWEPLLQTYVVYYRRQLGA